MKLPCMVLTACYCMRYPLLAVLGNVNQTFWLGDFLVGGGGFVPEGDSLDSLIAPPLNGLETVLQKSVRGLSFISSI